MSLVRQARYLTKSAIAFSKGFYLGLGYGWNIKRAFKLGCNQQELNDVPESQRPKLKPRQGVDPSEIFLIESEAERKDKSTQHNLLKESQYVPKIFPRILKYYKDRPLRFDGSDIHYVEPEAVLLGNSTWSRIDQDILTSGNTREKKGPIHKIVEQYLSNYKQQCTLIGGSFGSGKTTVAIKTCI